MFTTGQHHDSMYSLTLAIDYAFTSTPFENREGEIFLSHLISQFGIISCKVNNR